MLYAPPPPMPLHALFSPYHALQIYFWVQPASIWTIGDHISEHLQKNVSELIWHVQRNLAYSAVTSTSFWIMSHAFPSYLPPQTRAVSLEINILRNQAWYVNNLHGTCLSCADWCLSMLILC